MSTEQPLKRGICAEVTPYCQPCHAELYPVSGGGPWRCPDCDQQYSLEEVYTAEEEAVERHRRDALNRAARLLADPTFDLGPALAEVCDGLVARGRAEEPEAPRETGHLIEVFLLVPGGDVQPWGLGYTEQAARAQAAARVRATEEALQDWDEERPEEWAARQPVYSVWLERSQVQDLLPVLSHGQREVTLPEPPARGHHWVGGADGPRPDGTEASDCRHPHCHATEGTPSAELPCPAPWDQAVEAEGGRDG